LSKVLAGLLIFVGVIVVVAVILMILVKVMVGENNKDKGEYRKVLSAEVADAPKALVVYQPTVGDSGKTIAERIAAGLNENGYEVTLAYPSEKLSSDISAYDIVVLGSGVYAGKSSKALRDYVSSVDSFSGKTIFLYSVGSMETMEELDEFGAEIEGSNGLITFKFQSTDKDAGDKAYAQAVLIVGK
jgi:flavodoxin